MNKLMQIGIAMAAAIILGVGQASAAVDAGHESSTSMEEPGGKMEITLPIHNAQGQKIGEAMLKQMPNGVKVEVTAQGLTPGQHGIHFHEKGICEAPDFKTAGEHLNPAKKHHGLLNPQGPHAGDLPNLVVDEKGNGTFRVLTTLVTLMPNQPNSLLKEGGTSLVIHEKPDDEKTDPAGNSGSRIACGVIKR